jgi:hypothetical protein
LARGITAALVKTMNNGEGDSSKWETGDDLDVEIKLDIELQDMESSSPRKRLHE